RTSNRFSSPCRNLHFPAIGAAIHAPLGRSGRRRSLDRSSGSWEWQRTRSPGRRPNTQSESDSTFAMLRRNLIALWTSVHQARGVIHPLTTSQGIPIFSRKWQPGWFTAAGSPLTLPLFHGGLLTGSKDRLTTHLPLRHESHAISVARDLSARRCA